MQHPRWRDGRLSTGFIAEEFPDGFHPMQSPRATPSDGSPPSRRISIKRSTRASARISGQLRAPEQFRFETKRVVVMGRSAIELEVDGRGTKTAVTFEDGRQGRCALRLEGRRPSVARNRRRRGDRRPDAPDPQRLFAVACAASPSTRASITRREAELAALMIERKGADGSKTLLCPMPGLVKAISVKRRAGGQGGRAALHRRGDEDGERADRRDATRR